MRSPSRLGLWPALLTLGTACAIPPGPAPFAPPPAIDGETADWNAVPALITDPTDAPGTELDLLEVRARDDGRHFDLRLDLARPVSLQGMAGSLRILFDADGDPRTGVMREGLPGVDLELVFSRLDSSGQRRGGTQVLLPRGLSPYQLDLHMAPVYAAPRIELGFSRRHYFRGRSVSFKLVHTDHQNTTRDETSVGHYPLVNAEDAPLPAAVTPAAPQGTFRVLSWNVSDRSIRENPDPFLRTIRAIDPDILLLDEVSGQSSADEIASWFGGERWQVAFGTSGGYQRGVIAARSAVRQVDRFVTIGYADTSIAEFVRLAPDSSTRVRIQRSLENGVGASAATTEVGERGILLVVLDLWCCGSPGSYEERRRVVEAGQVRQLIGEARREAGVEGVIVAGDLNLVATRTPLDLLRRAGDLDGSDLEIAEPMQLDRRSNATWYGPTAPYLPSRLDYSLFSGSTLEAVQAFVFDPRDVAPAWLERYGITAAAVLTATDHLPVVVDFRWK